MISVSSFPVIHHTSPVVLVHGWRSGPWIFKRLSKDFIQQELRHGYLTIPESHIKTR